MELSNKQWDIISKSLGGSTNNDIEDILIESLESVKGKIIFTGSNIKFAVPINKYLKNVSRIGEIGDYKVIFIYKKGFPGSVITDYYLNEIDGVDFNTLCKIGNELNIEQLFGDKIYIKGRLMYISTKIVELIKLMRMLNN